MIERDGSIFLAGRSGLVGSAVHRRLREAGFSAILAPTRSELDLGNASGVADYFGRHRPRYVILAAARVGGILANSMYPADFIRQNLEIQQAVLGAAHEHGTEKLVFLGSSCIYPKLAGQPIAESELLGGHLEPTNAPYAVAKIAGVTMCQALWAQYGCRFISLMPTNLYGPGDNFDLRTSHVLPALIRKFHQGREEGAPAVTVWGSGEPKREFMHVDDLADAILFLMDTYESPEIVNVGTGKDVSIRQLAEVIREVVGFEGEILFDRSKPDGTSRKLLDVSRLSELGWRASIGLREGIESTYSWFLDNYDRVAV